MSLPDEARDDHLRQALRAAAVIAGNTINTRNDNRDPATLLRARIQELHEIDSSLQISAPPDSDSTPYWEFQSANLALFIIERINNALLNVPIRSSEKPLLGSRDLSNIRTLLALIFNWGTGPILARLGPSWSASSTRTRAQTPIIDLTANPADEEALRSWAMRLLHIVLAGIESKDRPAYISPILIDKHLSDMLLPAIAIGWLPHQMISCADANYEEARSRVMRLLQLLPASSNISALGTLLRVNNPPIPHIRKSASFLLGRQLLRPDGAKGLYSAIFGETNSDLDVDETTSVEKLEQVSRLIGSVPFGVKPEEYFALVLPKCIGFLDPVANPSKPSWLRASAFTLSRLITAENSNSPARKIALDILHGPFQSSGDGSSPISALRILSTLILNTDPLPGLMSLLFSNIIARIYTILEALSEHRMADPNDVELCNSIIVTWARIVETDEAREVLWSIVRGEGGRWVRENEDSWKWVESSKDEELPISVTDLLSGDSRDVAQSSNPFNLHPSPQVYVKLLQSIQRHDLTSELFVRLLNSYLEITGENDDPIKALLYIQIALQIQTQILQSEQGKDLLAQPERMLSFILHVLEMSQPHVDTKKPSRSGIGLQDLNIVQDTADDAYIEDGDSDDEGDEDATKELPSDITSTVINLLLSILEAHPTLSTLTSPTLDQIWDKLDVFAKGDDAELRSLVREARMVMAARLASPPTPSNNADGSPNGKEREASQAKYQKALKLLQDPILPVRAHGLTLLKELVSPASTKKDERGHLVSTDPAIDRALVPAIMAIFIQCIQEDDSYIFLNAVQGLSAMVDGFGRETLSSVVNEYSKGLVQPPITNLTKQELDVRLRIGEALLQVIERCGEALPAYSDLVVPHLLLLVRQRDAPVVLRISALSLLAQCVETNILSLSHHTNELASGMVDLLQLESVQSQNEAKDKTLDSDPITSNAKVAEFRRSAIHFLSLLTRSFLLEQQNSSLVVREHTVSLEAVRKKTAPANATLVPETTTRMVLTLRYIAATDSDAVAKVMARELLQLLEDT